METIKTNVTYYTDGINVEGLEIKLAYATRLNVLACKSDVTCKAYLSGAEVSLKRHQFSDDKEITHLVALDEAGEPDESLNLKTFTLFVDETGTVKITAWVHNNHEEYVEAEFTI